MTYLSVFIGGGLGAVARLSLSGLMARLVGTGFPWGTLAVNLLGALAIGILTEWLALKIHLPPAARSFLVTGFLGGFTTFSAFSIESAAMIGRGDYIAAFLYILASVVGTIALVLFATHTLRGLL